MAKKHINVSWKTKAKTNHALRRSRASGLVASGYSAAEAADAVGVSTATVYRYIRDTLKDLDAFRLAEVDDWRRALLADLIQELDEARRDARTQPTEENGLSFGQAAKIRNMARVTMVKIHTQIGRLRPGLYQGTTEVEEERMPPIVLVNMPVTALLPEGYKGSMEVIEGELEEEVGATEHSAGGYPNAR